MNAIEEQARTVERIGALGELGKRMLHLWRTQRDYNLAIKAVQTEKPANSWTEVYLLGMVGEVHEVLNAISWKYHKLPHPVDRAGVGLELADITKYLLSLWQEQGFNLDEVLNVCQAKTDELTRDLQRDWFPPEGQDVCIFDLDGTTADYRAGIAVDLHLEVSAVYSLAADLDSGVPWHEYEQRKAAWEMSGGYARLPAYADAVRLLRAEKARGTYLFCITARPADLYPSIRADTYSWLDEHGIQADAVLFGRDARLTQLLKLAANRNRVVLLEDEPVLADRAARMGFDVLLRDQPYNQGLEHVNIQRLSTFPDLLPWAAR